MNNNSIRISGRGWLTFVASGLLLGLGGCATVPKPSAAQATDAYVTKSMARTVDSVDQSLKELVALSRGDEGARKPSYIGTTVAGAAQPNTAPPVMPKKAQPQTSVGQKEEKARLNYNRLALQARVKVIWNGNPSELLKQMAHRIDYHFAEVGPGKFQDVHVKATDDTVLSVLRQVADQIKDSGAVKVLLGPRQVCLVHGSADTPCPPVPGTHNMVPSASASSASSK